MFNYSENYNERDIENAWGNPIYTIAAEYFSAETTIQYLLYINDSPAQLMRALIHWVIGKYWKVWWMKLKI